MSKKSRQNGAAARNNENMAAKIEQMERIQQKRARVENLRSLAGELINNSGATRNLGRLPGFSHDGNRDVWGVAGYLPYGTVTYQDYRQIYDRSLGGRIVDKWVESTWQKPPQISEDGNTDTAFVRDVTNLVERFDLWETLSLADTHASIGEFGIILVGVNDVRVDDMGQQVAKSDLKTAVEPDTLNGLDDLLYLRPYGQNSVTQITLNGDPTSKRFGQPELYHIRAEGIDSSGGTAIASTESPDLVVHWSRVIHLAENTLDNNVIGIPKMRRSLNVIMDILKTTAGSAEAYWRIVDRGMIAEIDSDVSATTDDLESIEEALDDYINNMSRWFILQNGKVKELGGRDVNPEGMFGTLEKVLAATSGIPNRIYFGSERGQLASGQDAKEWAAGISTRQKTYAEPVVRDLLDRLTTYGILTAPVGGVGAYKLGLLDETGNYDWPSILENDPKETADIQNVYATALNNAQTALVNGAIMTEDEVRSFGNLEATGLDSSGMLDDEDQLLGEIEAGLSPGDFSTLNGAQITAVLEVLDRVALGAIDDVAAVELISSVGLARAQAEKIVSRQKRKPAVEDVSNA